MIAIVRSRCGSSAVRAPSYRSRGADPIGVASSVLAAMSAVVL